MKWFFALNSTSLNGQRSFWEGMMLAAVASAQQHTDLQPHLLWDGGDDPFLETLQNRGVTVVRHRVTFYDALAQHAETAHEGWLSIASGAFMRTEIPLIVTDDLVLYTDCDVLFTGPFECPPVPTLFACAPEFEHGNTHDFNTGVMLMNTPALRASLPEFQTYIRGHLGDFGTFDQDAYRFFYENRNDALPDTYNWKPYWGVNDDARIVHFHGPKPAWVMRLLGNEDDGREPSLSELFERNLPAYVHYLEKWLTTARLAGATV